jgi:hypothetical protein
MSGAAVPPASLSAHIQAAVPTWTAAGKTAAWLTCTLAQGAHMAAVQQHGFTFHHAEGNTAVLFKWLAPGPCKIPPFATHQVGVAGVVRDPATGRLLVVKERAKTWGACVREARRRARA